MFVPTRPNPGKSSSETSVPFIPRHCLHEGGEALIKLYIYCVDTNRAEEGEGKKNKRFGLSPGCLLVLYKGHPPKSLLLSFLKTSAMLVPFTDHL